MQLINRKDWLCSAIAPYVMNCEGMKTRISLDECAEIICKETPRELREAVKETSCVLFRGEDVETASILSLMPDLLDTGTYNNPEALAYFSCLETVLDQKNVVAKPSTGHIATSSIDDAMSWGNPVSIWPLGRQWSYVWVEDRRLFYPGSCISNQENSLVCNEKISVALQKGSEVLFSTADSTELETRTLAVPSSSTIRLMAMLNKKQYGL